jgi:uncharacterized protein
MVENCFSHGGMVVMPLIKTLDELEALYQPAPALASTAKVLDHISSEYRQYIKASPFVALATSGPEGLDCSPRGDDGQCVEILEDRLLALPDRRGNNRIDSLRNILRDPRVALLFLIPGSNTTFRVNGTATISIDPQLLKQLEKDGKQPRSVILIKVEAAYFQCGRAVVRSKLWNPKNFVSPSNLPTPGTVLEQATKGEIKAKPYDDEWPGRASKTLW